MSKGAKRNNAWFSGAVIFFAVIALTIQIAVLVYDYIQERTQNNGLIAVLMLIVILMLSAICTVADIIRRKLMVEKPVKKILSATEQIAKGDFSTRLEIVHPYGKYDQYDLIMDNLNVMAAELEKTESLKTDLISNVSHELKTPLTVIKSYATLLKRKDLDEETREKYLDAVLQATGRLNDLITNILRLNKLENQEIKADLERFDLGEAVGESVLQFEEVIEKKSLELVCNLQESVYVYSSKSYLDIVWSNLLSNAVKFTDEGGRVEVNLKKEGKKAVVSVTDTGCGISAETGARIFEKFYQGDTSHASEGNGLGLALVKKVIDILGGEISVFSEEGKGSTFKVVLRCEE
nr:HAMP domain-containing histidine kinase [Clostridia bacterium]